jgi:hypothetical protein
VKGFLIGLLLGVIIVPVAVYGYFWSGSAPVATSASPIIMEKSLAKMALHARIVKEMPKTVPIMGDEANYANGEDLPGKLRDVPWTAQPAGHECFQGHVPVSAAIV